MFEGPKTRRASDHAAWTRAGILGANNEELFEIETYLQFWNEPVIMWVSLNAPMVIASDQVWKGKKY
jgi:hypothetical protein